MKIIPVSAILLFLTAAVQPCRAQGGTASGTDRGNMVVYEWNTDLATNTRFLDHETIYDSGGKKIQETEYTKLGKLWTKKYEYGQDGNVSRELTYNDRGRLDNAQTFEYNEFGRKKVVYTYDAKGRPVKMKELEYKYREYAGR